MGSALVLSALVLAGPFPAGTSRAAANILPDPQRPMVAENCHDALLRLREAAQGSPLISQEENQQHLFKALAQAEQLCADCTGTKQGGLLGPETQSQTLFTKFTNDFYKEIL